MMYVVEVRATPLEQELIMKQCPFGIWRSKNGLDHAVEFESLPDAERFFQYVDGHGYRVSQINEIAE